MSQRRRRWALYISLVAALVGVVLVGGKVQVDRLQAKAQRHAETGQAAIALLNKYKAGVEAFDIKRVLECYDDAYRNEAEGFWVQQLQAERDGVRTYEWQIEAQRPFHKSDQAEQMSRYFETVRSIIDIKFKLDEVEEITNAEKSVIRSFLWVIGKNAAGEMFQSQSSFRMWLAKTDAGFAISKQELLHGKTTIGDRRGFTNVTDEVGIDFIAKRNPLWTTPEWDPKMYGIMKFFSAGVSAADYDHDGWYDIFFADGAQPRLYHNNGDGTFSDVTAAAGLPTDLVGIHVAIFADFDNDGNKDLFLGSFTGANRLFRNTGDGTFTDVTENAGLGGYFVTVAAAGDYDNDGKLDLYLGRYLDPRKNLPTTFFYTRNGEGNSLLHNDGHFHFTDVTAKAGVREGGLTLGIAWADYNDDGYQDIYVVNDFGRSALFRNNGDGTFADVSKETGTVNLGFGMSATFGDINNDCSLDIYTAGIHSSQRWYRQAATVYQYFLTSARQGTIVEDFPLYMELSRLTGPFWGAIGIRTVKGNRLLLNDGNGKFTDASAASGANPLGWYWSSGMFDYDNDGRQDIYTVNGWVTAQNKDDL